MASATCSGVPTSAVVLPAPPTAAAMGVQSRLSWTSLSRAKPLRRLGPTASGRAPRRAPVGDALLQGGEGLAPQHVDVAVAGADGVRGLRGPAEVERDMRLLYRLDLGVGVGEAVELARVI